MQHRTWLGLYRWISPQKVLPGYDAVLFGDGERMDRMDLKVGMNMWTETSGILWVNFELAGLF